MIKKQQMKNSQVATGPTVDTESFAEKERD